jgi:bifunctional enzyme CysN/CysC
MFVHPNNLPRVDRSFEAMVVWMNDKPLVPGTQYLVKHATKLTTGGCTALRYRVDVNTLHRQDAAELKMNEVGRCKMTLSTPIAFDPYRKNRNTGAFIFIDRITNNTVGAGMIIDRESTLGGFGADLWDVVEAEQQQTKATGAVTADERKARSGHAPATILLTGLTGTGKSEIAYALERRLFDAGRPVYVLDGKRMRHGISKGLGFSAWERSENLRRSIEVARLMNDAGLTCICAFVAPDEPVRQKARDTVGADHFVEVYLTAPMNVLRERDKEGMYAKADSGEITEFPGVSAPYDPPITADLTLETHKLSVSECVDRIVGLLERRKLA